jgi:hypothetical protein
MLPATHLLASLLTAPTHAESLGQSLAGWPVIIEESPVETAVIFWSLDCSPCLTELEQPSADGVSVIAISTDPADAEPHLRAGPIWRAQRTHHL